MERATLARSRTYLRTETSGAEGCSAGPPARAGRPRRDDLRPAVKCRYSWPIDPESVSAHDVMVSGWTPTGASVSIEIPDFGQGDPSGADTFARYRYQARLTLFHWLGTLTPDGPLAVYAEHVEDILLHYTDRFLFIQVKTRVPTARQWTAESMCASGGGIDSL